MEYINCILCDLNNIEILFKKRDKFNITKDEFFIARCQKCRLLYINPRPSLEEMKKFYPENYSWKDNTKVPSRFTKLIRNFERKYRYHLLRNEVSKVIKYTKKNDGKILDIGCGTGDRLEVFREKGFEIYGIEPYDSADDAKNFLKLNIIKGDLNSVHFFGKSFDIVTMYNVLEHIHNPIQTCKEINRILKDDGYLVIQVPNIDSLQYKIFKRRWSAFDVPRDLYYFNVNTMRLLCKKTGFRIKKIDHFMTLFHPPTVVNSIFPKFEPQMAWEKERKGDNPFFGRIIWILLTLLSSPFTQLESSIRRGAILTFYLIKN